MARRGHGCRCCGCTIVDIFRLEQRPTPWLWENADPQAEPPTGLPPVSDGFPFATKREILRPWSAGGNGLPRGGSIRLNLNARAISVEGYAAPFLGNTSFTPFLGLDALLHPPGNTPSQAELNPFVLCSLFGDSLSASFALRIAPISRYPFAWDAQNEAPGVIQSPTWRPWKSFYYADFSNFIGTQGSPLIASTQPSSTQYPISFNDWQTDVYGNVLTQANQSGWRARRIAYAAYFHSRYEALQSTLSQLAGRPAIVLGNQVRLIQPEFGPGFFTAVNAATSRNSSVRCQIELVTVQDGDTIVATAKTPTAVSNGFGNAADASLIWSGPGVTNYSKNPLAGIAGAVYKATIYRDGEYVATVERSRPQSASNWTGPFAEHTSQSGSYLIQYDANAGRLQGFLSFVIDRTPPLGTWTQVNDFFQGDPTNAASATTGLAEARRVATEATFPDQFQGPVYISKGAEPDDYEIEQPGDYRDSVGNVMPFVPAAEYTIHELPEDEKYGAQATIALPPNAASDELGVMCEAAVPSLTITFNKPVAGMTAANVTVAGRKHDWESGDEDESLAFSLSGSGTTYTLTFNQESIEKQTYDSSWLAVLDPDGLSVVVPAGSAEDPGPCVLKSRRSWLVTRPSSRQVINTSSSVAAMGRVPTATTSVAVSSLPEATSDNATIDVTNEITLPDSAGKFHAANGEGFVPQAPATLDAAAALPHSYFGLPTTVFPSPPQSLSACAAPIAPQKHSSLIIGSNDITSITVELVLENASTGQTISASSLRLHHALAGCTQESDGLGSILGASIFPLLMSRPTTFSASLNGEPCSQNFWVNQQNGGPAFPAIPHTNRHSTFGSAGYAIGFSNDVLKYGRGSFETLTQPLPLNGNTWAGNGINVHATAGTLTASRSAATYEALQTSTLGELTLNVSLMVAYTNHVFDELVQKSPPDFWAAGAQPHMTNNAAQYLLLQDPVRQQLAATLSNTPFNNGSPAWQAAADALNNYEKPIRDRITSPATIKRPWPPQVVIKNSEDPGASGSGGLWEADGFGHEAGEDFNIGYIPHTLAGKGEHNQIAFYNMGSLLGQVYFVTNNEKDWVELGRYDVAEGVDVDNELMNNLHLYFNQLVLNPNIGVGLNDLAVPNAPCERNGLSMSAAGYDRMPQGFEPYKETDGQIQFPWGEARDNASEAVIGETFSLTREQEETLAAGGTVTIRKGNSPGGLFWRVGGQVNQTFNHVWRITAS